MSVLVGPDLCGGMGGRGCCCLGGSGWGGVWWLLPELLAGVPPPLLCVGTCGGGGRSSGVRLTSGVPCDPLWPPLLPRLPSAVTLSSSLSSESEILITISMLVQLSYGASQRALLHFLTTGWVVSMVGSSLEEAGLNPTTLQIEIFQSLPRGLWQPKWLSRRQLINSNSWWSVQVNKNDLWREAQTKTRWCYSKHLPVPWGGPPGHSKRAYWCYKKVKNNVLNIKNTFFINK